MGIALLFILAAVLLVVILGIGIVYQIAYPPRRTYAAAMARYEPTDPADIELTAEEATFSLSDGQSTPGWIIQGEQHENPQAPRVVLLHGYAESRYTSLSRTLLYTPHAAEVVVFDLRGHGDCPAPRYSGGLIEPDDLAAILDQQTKPLPTVLAGYSAGAGISLVTAAKQTVDNNTSSPIVGLILDGIYQTWDEPIYGMFRHRQYPAWPAIPLTGLVLRFVLPRFNAFDRKRYAAQLTGQFPTLYLHGTDDHICPYPTAQALAAATANSKLVTFQDSRHLDLHVNDREQYEAAIAECFNQIKANVKTDITES